MSGLVDERLHLSDSLEKEDRGQECGDFLPKNREPRATPRSYNAEWLGSAPICAMLLLKHDMNTVLKGKNP